MVLALNYNMHGVNIRSENAAKPHTMPSRYLCEYIRSIEKNGHALDFGCGKLRYSDELISKFDEVTFLDSKRQLEREQIIRGIKTKIIDYVPRYYKNANTVAFEDVDKIIGGYDFILCSNVLSAVPCRDTIDKIVLSIKRLLKSGGETLIVNQYKSSYFKNTKQEENIFTDTFTKIQKVFLTMDYSMNSQCKKYVLHMALKY